MDLRIGWLRVTLDITTTKRRLFGSAKPPSDVITVSVGLRVERSRPKGAHIAPSVLNWLWENHPLIWDEFHGLNRWDPRHSWAAYNHRIVYRRAWRIARLERMDYLYSLSL